MRDLARRLRVISLALVLAALILVAKLYFVQIVSGETYRERALSQQIVGSNFFDRGSIFFSTKDGTVVPAATIENGYLLALDTSKIEDDPEDIYDKLSTIVPLNKEVFLARAGKKDRYEELIKRLDGEAATKIRELKIPGVVVARNRWRTYPGGTMAAHTLGLIGYQGDELAGRYGLEREYEDTLRREGDGAFASFFVELFANIKKTLSPNEGLEGDVVTTIEPSAQAFLEKELEELNARYSSAFSGGIIMDPHTGAIIGMAVDPTFEPGDPGSAPSSAIFRNNLVEDRYEMGSIVKALTYAAGLDAGVITARTTYNDPGCITLNQKTFCNYDGESHGTGVTMQEALSQSLNTGAAYVVSRLGNKTFAEYMFNFGLDKTTDIDLPNEGNSLVSNLKTNRDLEHAQASFGQGIALTPIATIRALSALANGGTLPTPHLAKSIHYKIGTSRTLNYPAREEQPRVIEPETAEEISRMLTVNVDESLRFGTMRLEAYSIAAKTGTAQIASPTGGYYPDRYLHSFFGYFPSYDPRFIVFLYTYEPKGVQFASETLTDTFFNTSKFLISYYKIPPDRESAPPGATSIR